MMQLFKKKQNTPENNCTRPCLTPKTVPKDGR
jgi:hypothetical protein